MKILIVGAGISGLAMAIALEKMGLHPRVVEKSPKLRIEGLGIALPMNGVSCLNHLGLKDKLIRASCIVKNIIYSLPNGEILSKKSLLDYPLNRHPFVALTRKQLITLLVNSLKSSIEYDKHLVDISFNSSVKTAKIKFSDNEIAEFDLVISADGIHSTVRQKLFQDKFNEDINIRTWRFIANFVQEDPIYYIGKKSVFMIYPISKTRVYCYAHIPEVLSSTVISKNKLDACFKEYSEKVNWLIHSTSPAKIISDQLLSVSNQIFYYMNVAFIGDAAHACSPMLQQGAASAFEDAITLAKMLNQFPNIGNALRHYSNIRLPRTEWIRDNSDIPLKALTSYVTDHDYRERDENIRKNGPINVAKWKILFAKDYFELVDQYLKGQQSRR